MRKSVVLWVVSVTAAAGLSAVVTAQRVRPVEPPRILSEVGFRVEGQRTESRNDPMTGARGPVDIVTGHLVVRVNGQWVEAELSGGRVRPLTN